MGRHSLAPTTEDVEVTAPTPDQAPTGPIQIPVSIPIPRRPVASSGPLPVVRPPVPVEVVPVASVPEVAPRLLAGWLETGRPADLDEHLRRYGEPPRARFGGRRGARRLVELVDEAGLRGRGGAGFPTARKMATVLSASTPRRRPVVVANGCEGDPTSGKDRLLLQAAPHLVLDGMALAAHAVGADQAVLCVHRDSPLVEPLEAAIDQRSQDPADVYLVTVPRRYVASEASAVVNFLTSGEARPTSVPPLPAERGVQGRPTLVDNVETLAHLALLARYGADWFRDRGTEDSPGTTLVTMDGAVRHPGVYEVDMGASAGHLLRLAGGATDPIQALLLGGLGGSWLPAAGDLSLGHFDCAAAGAGLGVASLLALPVDACGLSVTAAILRYLADESAGQCGPCMFGLPALAEDITTLAAGTADTELPERLRRRLGVIPGRGACAHPDGAVRLAASTLRVFTDDIAQHLRGRPCGRPDRAAFPVLRALTGAAGGWR